MASLTDYTRVNETQEHCYLNQLKVTIGEQTDVRSIKYGLKEHIESLDFDLIRSNVDVNKDKTDTFSSNTQDRKITSEIASGKFDNKSVEMLIIQRTDLDKITDVREVTGLHEHENDDVFSKHKEVERNIRKYEQHSHSKLTDQPIVIDNRKLNDKTSVIDESIDLRKATPRTDRLVKLNLEKSSERSRVTEDSMSIVLQPIDKQLFPTARKLVYNSLRKKYHGLPATGDRKTCEDTEAKGFQATNVLSCESFSPKFRSIASGVNLANGETSVESSQHRPNHSVKTKDSSRPRSKSRDLFIVSGFIVIHTNIHKYLITSRHNISFIIVCDFRKNYSSK